jgi:hypothetical protein
MLCLAHHAAFCCPLSLLCLNPYIMSHGRMASHGKCPCSASPQPCRRHLQCRTCLPETLVQERLRGKFTLHFAQVCHRFLHNTKGARRPPSWDCPQCASIRFNQSVTFVQRGCRSLPRFNNGQAGLDILWAYSASPSILFSPVSTAASCVPLHPRCRSFPLPNRVDASPPCHDSVGHCLPSANHRQTHPWVPQASGRLPTLDACLLRRSW